MERAGRVAEDLLSTGLNITPIKDGDTCECGGTGWIQVASTDNYSRVKMCMCQKRKIMERRVSVILEDWPEYSKADLWTVKPRSVGQENVLRIIREDPKASFYLTGTYKRGKTYFLIAQYRCRALTGTACLLRSSRDLMHELRRAEVPGEGGKTVASPVLEMVNAAREAHLFIDDIEKTANTGFRDQMIWDILDTIKRRQLSLSVSSNLPLISKNGQADLRGKLGHEIVSRLDQICKVVEI